MPNPNLIMKVNLSRDDKVTYFSEQWTSHRDQQKQDVKTDVTLIGLDGNGGYKSVKVSTEDCSYQIN